jgi:hypothetical protein
MASLTSPQLIVELSIIVDPNLAKSAVEDYIDMQQRFLAGDWKPTELNGGRLCEAIARCIHQLDVGSVTHSKLPGEICDRLENETVSHNLAIKDRHHIAKVLRVLYKFRSDRGAVHISPFYSANELDSVLVLHLGKWLFSEFLRLAWNKDRQIIAETIQRIVRLEHSLIHELDGKPLVLATNVTAKEEILLQLNHATGNCLSRNAIRDLVHQKPANISVAISRMLKDKEVRTADNGDIALTPIGQKRIFEEIIPKLNPYK